MTAPAILAFIWAASVAGLAVIVGREILRDSLAAKRSRRAHADRDAAVQARRAEDDSQWAGVESEWHAFVDSHPVLDWDPEKLGQ